jgi:hypothetical protein
LLCSSYTTSQAGHALVAPAASVPESQPTLPDLSRISDAVVTSNAVITSDAVVTSVITSDAVVTSEGSDAVVTADPPGNAADAMLSHSVDILLVLVKPVPATANKRKKAAPEEQKYGPIDAKLSAGFDSIWAKLAQLIEQSTDVFDINSAEWRFMTPASSARNPFRDAKALPFLAKLVHNRATLRTPKNTDIYIYVRLCPHQVQRQVCFSQFYVIGFSNINGTGCSS